MTEDSVADRDQAMAPPEERGSLTIADKVIEKLASAAAHEIDDVLARASGWRRMTGRPLPRATATVAGGRARIGVDIATSWPTPLTEVAAQTRDHIKERVVTLSGVDVVAVDVTIAQVRHSATENRKVQ